MVSPRFDPEAVNLLVAAGWFEGRQVSDATIDSWAARTALWLPRPMPSSARSALREFGGLTIGKTGPGREMAASSLRFNPGYGDELVELEELVGRLVYPLGDTDHGHGIIAMDEGGCAYLDWLHAVFITGPSLDALMTRELLGLRPPAECVLLDKGR